MPCPLQNRLDRILEKEKKVREKSRIKFLKEIGFATTNPDGESAPKPKKKRAISSTQILNRFAEFPTRRARPVLLFQLIELLDLEEVTTLHALINGTSKANDAKHGERPDKPKVRIPSKANPPITAAQILKRFRQMKEQRPQLAFDMSKCLTPREKRTLQDLIDSAFRGKAYNANVKKQVGLPPGQEEETDA